MIIILIIITILKSQLDIRYSRRGARSILSSSPLRVPASRSPPGKNRSISDVERPSINACTLTTRQISHFCWHPGPAAGAYTISFTCTEPRRPGHRISPARTRVPRQQYIFMYKSQPYRKYACCKRTEAVGGALQL